MTQNRRAFLRAVSHIGGAMLGGPWVLSAAGCNCSGGADAGLPAGGVAGEATGAAAFHPDLEFALRAVQTTAQLIDGRASEVWTFRGQVLAGSASALVDLESGALGPTFHVRRGQRIRIKFQNDLAEPSVVHWHGLSVPETMDGHPRFAVDRGRQYVYEFEVRNRAGTYWYHAHPDRRTGPQVYRGMAGLFIVHDADEDALTLPRDDFDVPLVIQDRSFDANNQLVYAPSPMDAMNGWLGDRVLVNGKVDSVLRVQTRAYRLRILNGSNSRIYRLAWGDGSLLTVIGTDGGLLSQPVQRPYVMLGPAERVELWADFSERTLGSELLLSSLPFEAGGGMGPMAAGLRQGAPLAILTLRVDQRSSERLSLPQTLTHAARYREADAFNAAAPRRIVPTQQHMTWGLNGRSFELDAVASDEHVKLGSLEAWEFDNTGTDPAARGGMGMGRGMAASGGMGMTMAHPMHLHGGQFQISSRQGVTHSGYVDDGWKDTVLVMPGEKARLLMRYVDYLGLYLYHCHNLEHEDGGMMRNIAVEG